MQNGWKAKLYFPLEKCTVLRSTRPRTVRNAVNSSLPPSLHFQHKTDELGSEFYSPNYCSLTKEPTGGFAKESTVCLLVLLLAFLNTVQIGGSIVARIVSSE